MPYITSFIVPPFIWQTHAGTLGHGRPLASNVLFEAEDSVLQQPFHSRRAAGKQGCDARSGRLRPEAGGVVHLCCGGSSCGCIAAATRRLVSAPQFPADCMPSCILCLGLTPLVLAHWFSSRLRWMLAEAHAAPSNCLLQWLFSSLLQPRSEYQA